MGWLAILAIAGLLSGISQQAATAADADHIFADCTFTLSGLDDALNTTDEDIVLEASYILVYVRNNPNNGQQIGDTGTYTGPILCRNVTEAVTETTETTQVPDVNILDAEEAFHLRFEPAGGGQSKKRVCHTVAGNTDCFFIQAGGGF